MTKMVRVELLVPVEDEDGFYDDVSTWDWTELVGPGVEFLSAELEPERTDRFWRLLVFKERADTGHKNLVTEARRLHDEESNSWANIGKALGVTRQAAWERFGRGHTREQDGRRTTEQSQPRFGEPG